MVKYVLSMTLFSGLPGGGLIGGALFLPGCGEDATPGSPLPSEGEGQGEGEGEGAPVEGEGEGEGPRPPGADGEPCGGASKNECQDGYECMTCDEGNVESVPDERSPGDTKPCDGRICTCPQWFEGRWMVEYTNVRAVDYEYDFTKGSGDRELWAPVEIAVEQNGCTLVLPENRSMLGGRRKEGRVDPPPLGFWFKRRRAMEDGREGFVTFSGHLSEDHRIISGECDGEYDDVTVSPGVFFHVTCNFTLTRR